MRVSKYDTLFTHAIYTSCSKSLDTDQLTYLNDLCESYRLYVQIGNIHTKDVFLRYILMYDDFFTSSSRKKRNLSSDKIRPLKRVSVQLSYGGRQQLLSNEVRDESVSNAEIKRQLIESRREQAELRDMVSSLLKAFSEQQEATAFANVSTGSSVEFAKLEKGLNEIKSDLLQGKSLSDIPFEKLPDWLQHKFTSTVKDFAMRAISFPFSLSKNIFRFTFVKIPQRTVNVVVSGAEVVGTVYVIAVIICGSITLYTTYSEEVAAIAEAVYTPTAWILSPTISTIKTINEISGVNKYILDPVSALAKYIPSDSSLKILQSTVNIVSGIGSKFANMFSW